MSATTQPQQNRRRRRLAGILVVATLTVASLATGSLAVFTDNADSSQNTFTAGTIDLSLTEGATYALFSSTDVKPGDYVTATGNDAAGDWIKLLVNNIGVNGLRYAMTSTVTDSAGTGNLEDQLLVKVALTTVPGSCAPADLGTVLYGGANGLPISGLAFGNRAFGADTGDQTVAASASQTLCFWAHLPFNTSGWTWNDYPGTPNPDNAMQGDVVNVTLQFWAEQTKNN